jgi:hypothetical protein
LLRTVIEFFYSSQREEFQRLQVEIAARQQEGRRRFAAEEYELADREFREAIGTIDATGFLADLVDERVNLIQWLRKNSEKARRKGILLPEEPPLPDPSLRETGYRGRFFQLLSEMFTARDRGGEPLQVYEVGGSIAAGAPPERSLGPSDFGQGIVPTRAPGSLSRVRWAERWIRSNIQPATWPDPSRPAGTGGAPRLLERYGDLLIVQHARTVQQEVADLLVSFAQEPAPLVVDAAVFAAAEGGTVRAAEVLKAAAKPKDSGLDLVVRGRLIEECVRDLQGADRERLLLLGTARLPIKGESSATLELTQRTADHPLHDGLKPPALTVPDDLARYGLWLEVYAEDLPGAKGGPRSSALSVRALTRRPLGSVVIPKPHHGGAWTRLPRMAEQAQESDPMLPHAGTLVLLGVANPFAGSSESHPDLVILLSARPASGSGAPVPDPPRAGPLAPDLPEGVVDRGHEVGTLATEVLDEVVLDGWPQRPATVPVPPLAAREFRDGYLAGLIADLSGLRPSGPGESNPVAVRDGIAQARVSPEAHVRIESAVRRLAEAEDALYEVTVLCAPAPLEQASQWASLPGVTPAGDGRYSVTASAAEGLASGIRGGEPEGGLYAADSVLLCRATQKTALKRIHSVSIVEDLRARRQADGTQRYIPLYGRVEEGIVVEVRPGIEEAGRRMVTVRVRAARLKALEPELFAGVDQQAARVQVPQYHPLLDASGALSLADGESMLVVKRVPEGGPRAVVVLVTTRKVQ